MKQQEIYSTPQASWLMRLFWKAAGGDRFILERATYSDQIKYMCLGGIVVATGMMAGLAGGYAFYTIFSPKGSALEDVVDMATLLKSIVFGILWGLMIFNMDRFIVTSTGKGDGTEKITWDEFRGAIPRIILGMIIAITISKPIEIRIFKTEIDNKLYEEQLILKKNFEEKTLANFKERFDAVKNEEASILEERNKLMIRLEKVEKEEQDNLMGRAPGISAGYGPRTKKLEADKNVLKQEIDRFDERNKVRLDDVQQRNKKLQIEKEAVMSNNEKVANGLDGLLERIKLAHEIAGWAITTFITLLFMAIELTPIFFKLMLIKTPYDYLSENRDELIKANFGIEVRYDYYLDKEGQERHLVINHEADQIIYEKIKVSEIQKELTDYAIAKYKEREKENIDKNLDEYIKKINQDD